MKNKKMKTGISSKYLYSLIDAVQFECQKEIDRMSPKERKVAFDEMKKYKVVKKKIKNGFEISLVKT